MLATILRLVIAGGPQDERVIQRWAGYLNWASMAYPIIRPFMAHFYAFLAVASRNGRISAATFPGRLTEHDR